LPKRESAAPSLPSNCTMSQTSDQSGCACAEARK